MPEDFSHGQSRPTAAPVDTAAAADSNMEGSAAPAPAPTPGPSPATSGLSAALVAHARWLASAGANGSRFRLADHAVLGRRKPVITNASLEESDLTDGDMSGWSFENVRFDGADVDGLNADRARFSDCSLRRIAGKSARFNQARLVRTPIERGIVGRLELGGATLEASSLDGLVVGELEADGADFSGCGMNLIVRRGGSMRAARIEGCPVFLDARNVDMTGATVNGGSFSGRLTECALDDARITDADARRADWLTVTATGARIERCDLSGMRNRGCVGNGLEVMESALDGSAWRACDLTAARISASRIGGIVLDDNLMDEARLVGLVGMPKSFQGNTAEDATELPESLARIVWGTGRRKETGRTTPEQQSDSQSGLR